MKRGLVAFGAIAGALTIVACAAAWQYWTTWQADLDRRIYLHDSSELFELERGMTVRAIARTFEDKGWIRDARYVRLEARRTGIGPRLQAGLYEIFNGMTTREVLDKFVRGDVKTFRITFIEGSTFADVRRVLGAQRYLVQHGAALDDDELLAQVAPGVTHPEGWFFPSTYHYVHGDSDIDILRRAHREMRNVLEASWATRTPGLPYATPADALVMASIIEKETGRADERTVIAGVFVRRLQRGMKLQTDPTVIYGLGTAFDGDLRRVDLETDNPYNTYTRFGLPPTPIALPGRASIEAALHPANGSALYFVGRGDGSHEFSDSLEEHNAAVRRYQLRGRHGGN